MTLKFIYTKIEENRYLRTLEIEGRPDLIVKNILNFDVVEGNPTDDFNKWRNKINSVRVEKAS